MHSSAQSKLTALRFTDQNGKSDAHGIDISDAIRSVELRLQIKFYFWTFLEPTRTIIQTSELGRMLERKILKATYHLINVYLKHEYTTPHLAIENFSLGI